MLHTVREITIGSVTIGGNAPLTLIAGPCVIENKQDCLSIAQDIARIRDTHNIQAIFKASFDKANRTSVTSFRGPGIHEGLDILHMIHEKTGLPIVTDIHEPAQAAPVAEVVDLLQIPAFLCRQTDILIAAGETGKPVNVKKGQFLSPHEVINIITKIESTGNTDIAITERGSSFGYNTLINDLTAIPTIRDYNVPVIFDATHSVQTPGGQGTCSGGNAEAVPFLARAATAVGIDAIFFETHFNPKQALCDGPNMIPLPELDTLISTLMSIDSLIRSS